MLELLMPPAEMPGLEWRALVAVAFTAAAAYYDIFNRKWVPNWLVYGFAIAAIGVNLIFFDAEVFVRASILGIVVFALSYVLYRLGQLGGADAYAMAAIAACIPYLPSSFISGAQSIPYPFILSVMVPTSVFFILHMMARFIPYISRQAASGRMAVDKKDAIGAIIVLAAFAAFMAAIARSPLVLPPAYFGLVSLLVVALAFFSLFKSQIKDSMVEMVPPALLQEEDVLALEKMDAALVKKLSLSPVLTAQSISALKKSKLKSFPVYTGMPFFLPYLFLGLIATLLFGDLLPLIFRF